MGICSGLCDQSKQPYLADSRVILEHSVPLVQSDASAVCPLKQNVVVLYFWLQCLHTHLKYSLDLIPVVCCQDASWQQTKINRFYCQLRERENSMSVSLSYLRSGLLDDQTKYIHSDGVNKYLHYLSMLSNSNYVNATQDAWHGRPTTMQMPQQELSIQSSQRPLRNGLCAVQAYFEGKFICRAHYNVQYLKVVILQPDKEKVLQKQLQDYS